MIVCGPPASPHDPVHESDANEVYYVYFVDAANQSVATHNPDVPSSRFARAVLSMRRGLVHERKRESCPLHAWHKKCTRDLVVTRNQFVGGSSK